MCVTNLNGRIMHRVVLLFHIIFNNYFLFYDKNQEITYLHFSPNLLSVSVISTKLGKDIAWGKGHFVRENDLK